MFKMKKAFYMAVMRMTEFVRPKDPYNPVYMWAYRKCFRLFMERDPISGYWAFAEEYLGK